MSYNKNYETWLRGNNTITQGSGYSDNVSLRCDGKTELRGDTYITNSGRLMINKNKNSTTTYNLDVSGNSCFNGDIVIQTKNTLSNVQYVSTAITLTFGSAEYVAITSSFPNGGYITMPVVTSVLQIGTKFTFFYSSDSNPDVSIFAGSGQFLLDNLYSITNGNINLSYSRTFIELVCTSLTSPQWSQSNGSNDYQLFPQLIGVNNWSSNNYFNTILPTSTITTFNNNNQFVTKFYTDGKFAPLASPALTGNPTCTTQLTTDNSTRIASTAYVKSNLSSYQLTSGMSSYLTSATASTTYQTITGMSSYLTTSSASTTYQPISSMSNYVLQSYLDANYNTSAYINNNFASLSATNTFLGGGSFDGALAFKGNTSIINSKVFSITAGSTFNSDSGSTANFNGTTNFSTVPTINSVNIATLNNIPSTSLIYAPSFRSNSQSAGGVI
jgi:hypothetical protein